MLHRIFAAICAIPIIAGTAIAQQSSVCDKLNGASVIAQDDENTFLGKIESRYASDSIFNEYGNFGSPYSNSSIWNEYSNFGGQYSRNSPFNSYTDAPPILIKRGKVLGYLTTNKSKKPSITPNLLRELCANL